MFDVPSSHPFGSFPNLLKSAWCIGWRWLLAGMVGIVSGIPILSLLLGFVLFGLLLREYRTVDFWKPYGILSKKIWLVRFGTICMSLLALWNDANRNADLSMSLVWAAAVLAFLIESFLVLPALAAMKEEQ